MIILAFESSCDETSVAVVKDGFEVLSNITVSQIDIHKVFGGVVPEVASRNHIKYILPCLDEALLKAGIKVSDIDYVAVTVNPGLLGALIVGINAAYAYAYANDIKIIEVDHLMGHIYSSELERKTRAITFPAITLLISGGHTELLLLERDLKVEVLGQTRDDAVGEAYDKVARSLNLSYPGGPIIDKLSTLGKDTYILPRPLLRNSGFDFSFSGLKSAVINIINKENDIRVNDMCTSFQNAVLDVLINKTKDALEKYKVKTLIIAGGVSANKGLRARISEFKNVDVIVPPLKYCTDNAAMIACAAYYMVKKKQDDKTA